MPNQQLIDYIKQAQAAGQSNDAIKAALLVAGWQEADIDEGFSAIAASAAIGEKSKTLIVAVSALAILLLAGGGFAYWKFVWQSGQTVTETVQENSQLSPQNNNQASSNDESCSTMKDQIQLDSCYFNLARQTKEVDLCDKIKENDLKDACYYSIALFVHDAKICSSIQRQHFIEGFETPLEISVKDTCFSLIAVDTLNMDTCELITPEAREKQLCYLQVAEAKKEPILCSEVLDEYLRNNCYRDIAVETLAPDICKDITIKNSDRALCYAAVAKKAGDIDICKNITSEGELWKCITDTIGPNNDPNACDVVERPYWSSCVLNIAKAKKDIRLCDQLGSDKDFCYGQVAGVMGSIDICKMLDQQGINTDICYSEVGQTIQDSSLCSSVKAEYWQTSCYKNIALSTKDESVCEKLSEQGEKEFCYANIAGLKKDVLICDNIQTEAYKKICFSKIALATVDSSYCQTQGAKEEIENCYMNVVKHGGNINLCGSISNNDIRFLCYTTPIAVEAQSE